LRAWPFEPAKTKGWPLAGISVQHASWRLPVVGHRALSGSTWEPLLAACAL